MKDLLCYSEIYGNSSERLRKKRSASDCYEIFMKYGGNGVTI